MDELRREPAAAIFARAHAGPRADEHEALFGSVLLPLLMSTAEMCGGFDWDDSAYERAYAELEAALFGEGHQYGAVAPLIGITTGGATIELGAEHADPPCRNRRARKALARGQRPAAHRLRP